MSEEKKAMKDFYKASLKSAADKDGLEFLKSILKAVSASSSDVQDIAVEVIQEDIANEFNLNAPLPIFAAMVSGLELDLEELELTRKLMGKITVNIGEREAFLREMQSLEVKARFLKITKGEDNVHPFVTEFCKHMDNIDKEDSYLIRKGTASAMRSYVDKKLGEFS